MQLLDGRIKVETHGENMTIVKHGVADESRLMLVLSGSIKLVQIISAHESGTTACLPHSTLKVHLADTEQEEEVIVSTVLPDELVGGLQLLTGEPSFYAVRTRTPCRTASISSSDFYDIMSQKPAVVLPVCKSILSRLSPFLRGIDFALDWRMIDSGQALYRYQALVIQYSATFVAKTTRLIT